MPKSKQLIYKSNTPQKTKKLGEILAKTVLKSGKGDRARIFLLYGDLGVGKLN